MLRRLAAVIVVLTSLGVFPSAASRPESSISLARNRAAIERLHQQDIAATLSDRADDFGKIWNDNGVRLQPDQPAEVGKAVIYARDKREETMNSGFQILTYDPQIKELQIVGDWAFEWGYFDGTSKASPAAKPVTLRAKILGVLKRQPDGSWRFYWAMWNTAEPRD